MHPLNLSRLRFCSQAANMLASLSLMRKKQARYSEKNGDPIWQTRGTFWAAAWSNIVWMPWPKSLALTPMTGDNQSYTRGAFLNRRKEDRHDNADTDAGGGTVGGF